MKLIAITDIKSGAILDTLPDFTPSVIRTAVRGLTTDEQGQVYLLYVAKDGYYKLPGGGVDPGESFDDALTREMLEETGFTIKNNGEIGMVIQVDVAGSFRQDSLVYDVTITGGTGIPSFTADEAASGFEVKRFNTLDAALDALEHQSVRNYMTIRDVLILKAARNG